MRFDISSSNFNLLCVFDLTSQDLSKRDPRLFHVNGQEMLSVVFPSCIKLSFCHSFFFFRWYFINTLLGKCGLPGLDEATLA